MKDVAASSHVVHSSLALLPSKTGGRWKRQKNEVMRAGTRRFIRKLMLWARLRWRSYIVLIFLWAQGHSQLRRTSPSNYRSGSFPPNLLSLTTSVNRFFFPFKSNHLALRPNSPINTMYFTRIYQQPVRFALFSVLANCCCVWDSSTRQQWL